MSLELAVGTGWLLVAFVAGGSCGIALMALLSASRDDSELKPRDWEQDANDARRAHFFRNRP